MCRHFRRSYLRYTIFALVSEEQIQKWADEAEAGYEAEELERRGRTVSVADAATPVEELIPLRPQCGPLAVQLWEVR